MNQCFPHVCAIQVSWQLRSLSVSDLVESVNLHIACQVSLDLPGNNLSPANQSPRLPCCTQSSSSPAHDPHSPWLWPWVSLCCGHPALCVLSMPSAHVFPSLVLTTPQISPAFHHLCSVSPHQICMANPWKIQPPRHVTLPCPGLSGSSYHHHKYLLIYCARRRAPVGRAWVLMVLCPGPWKLLGMQCAPRVCRMEEAGTA